jgi:hypothetical protein
VKTLSVCVLSSLLSIVAYAGISEALSGAGQPTSEMPAPRSVHAPVPALANKAEDFAEYVHLHTTRGEGGFLHGATSARACTE